MEILEAINAHLGTCITANSKWEDIFKEATTDPDVENTYLNPAEDWPSEDSEDEDCNPKENENSASRTGIEENIIGDSSSPSSLFCSSDEVMSYSELVHTNGNGKSCDVEQKERNNATLLILSSMMNLEKLMTARS